MDALQTHTFLGPRPGPRLLILGRVHGDETCGTVAQQRVLDDIAQDRLEIAAGQATFVPVANPRAAAQGTREGERNLNRDLRPREAPADVEDRLANVLCPLLASHDVLLDLHSFSAPGRPFVLLGPPDNDGPLEPFRHAADEHALAVRLGVDRAVHGWLGTYAAGLAARGRHDWRHGVGTTEYMRQCGGWGVTLECGQHRDPSAPDVGERAIRNALAWLGLVDANPDAMPAPRQLEGLHLALVVERHHVDDRLVREWRPFDAVRAGEPVGVRADGTPVPAPFDGRIVFPNPSAPPGDDWYYLARHSDRF